MADIQAILDNHSFEVQGLLRKHKIAGPLNIDTVKKAYQAKGEAFMMELLQIITPTSNYGTDLAPDWEVALNSTSTEQSTNSQTKGWGFWDNLLTYVTKTGSTIQEFKSSMAGSSPGEVINQPVPAQSKKSNALIWIAGGFILLILLILIFRKK